jgi:hypothetical protein
MYLWVGKDMKAYLLCMFCEVKTQIRGERCHTLISRSACVCGYNRVKTYTIHLWYEWSLHWTRTLRTWLSFCMSLHVLIIFSIFGPSCVQLFSFFGTFMCPIFYIYFCIAMSLQLYIERDHYFVEYGVFISKTYLLSTPNEGVEFLVDGNVL